MGKKHFMTIAAALFLGAGLLSAQRPEQQVKRDEVPMPTVHQDTLMKHVMELSSETYRGRLAGTEGYDRADMDMPKCQIIVTFAQLFQLERIDATNCHISSMVMTCIVGPFHCGVSCHHYG